jgi:hypothetical protein
MSELGTFTQVADENVEPWLCQAIETVDETRGGSCNRETREGVLVELRPGVVSWTALCPEHLAEWEAAEGVDLEELFPGDPVQQTLYSTLQDREAGTHEEIMEALDEAYDYDHFGRWVDSFEDVIAERRAETPAT